MLRKGTAYPTDQPTACAAPLGSESGVGREGSGPHILESEVEETDDALRAGSIMLRGGAFLNLRCVRHAIVICDERGTNINLTVKLINRTTLQWPLLYLQYIFKSSFVG